jgi:hypothetical protein
MTETVLIFPAGVPDALKYRAEAAERGCRVVGASSLAWNPEADRYDAWEYLPYVHDPEFGEALTALIVRLGISAVYAPHEVVSGHLAEILPVMAPGVALISASPLLAKEREYRALHARAEAIASAPDWFGGGAPRMHGARLAGLLRLVDGVPGMSDNDKIAAMIEVARHLPDGDIVEIGSWWGRSAALLTLLSRHHDRGSVLCVDPWRADALPQGVAVLDRASAAMDLDDALRIFETNLAPIGLGRVNYIRAPSTEAVTRYGPGLEVESEALGRTTYLGRIALLHIDGNHALERVTEDCDCWTPHMTPGGWVVFDDYVWAFGDGPQQVGDAYCARNASRIVRSFVMGTALFVQLEA